MSCRIFEESCLVVLASFFLISGEAVPTLNLSTAVVVAPGSLSPQERKAAQMLVEEVEKRTGIRWRVSQSWPAEKVPVVAVGTSSSLTEVVRKQAAAVAPDRSNSAAEGYRIRIADEGPGPAVLVIGNDAR